MVSPAQTFARMVTALAVAGALGCSPGVDDYTSEAADSVETTVHEGALLVAAYDPARWDATRADRLAVIAAGAVARARLAYRPASCVTATANGATVTYEFVSCNGGVGLRNINGRLTFTFGTAANNATVRMASTGLVIDGARLNFDAEAVFTAAAGAVQMQVNSNSAGRGARGVNFSRRGRYAVRWEPVPDACYQLDGQWDNTLGLRRTNTQVTDFRRCASRCPQPGGRVVYSQASGATLTITFPGGVNAQWQSSAGRSGLLPLDCEN